MVYKRMAVYVVAHQDDWQLFMDPNVSADMVDPNCKTIIIHTTAGDAGMSKKYWRAREWGAVNSVLFRMSDDLGVNIVKKNINIHNKCIHLVNVGNCTLYFLRLPDGGMYGNGFEQYEHQSIERLRLHAIGEIRTVDAVNVFFSFTEISNLINAIIRKEQKGLDSSRPGHTTLNFPDYDHAINPNDHSDHLNTALLLGGMEIYPSAKKCAFVHYHIQHAAIDLQGTDLFWKVGMFSVYHQTVLNRYGHSTIAETQEYCMWSRKSALFREIN